MWTNILDEKDIESLMDTYGYFHDSCIVGMTYDSKVYVDHRFAMHMRSCPDTLVMVIQRQRPNPKTIELLFEGVKRANLAPAPEDYSNEILLATLRRENDMFIWAETSFKGDVFDQSEFTWIASRALKWRIVDGE